MKPSNLKKILVAESYPQSVIDYLKSNLSNFEIKTFKANQILQKDLSQVVGLLIRSRTLIDDRLIKQAPQLKIVGTATSGFDHIQWQALQTQGLLSFYTPDANTEATADLSMWHILSCLRDLKHTHRNSLNWRSDLKRGSTCFGLRLGILGLGRIGQRLAKRAQAFGFENFYYDPYLDSEQKLNPNFFAPWIVADLKLKNLAKPLELLELVKHCDIISLHLPLSSKTRGIINKNTLCHFGSDKILINCARGELVQEEDLLTALDSGVLQAAGLDTFVHEPLKPESILRKHPKLVWTPHIGAYTEQALTASCQEAAQTLIDFVVKKKSPKNPLPPQAAWAKDL